MQIATFSWRAATNRAPSAWRLTVTVKLPLPTTPKNVSTPAACRQRATTSTTFIVARRYRTGPAPRRRWSCATRSPAERHDPTGVLHTHDHTAARFNEHHGRLRPRRSRRPERAGHREVLRRPARPRRPRPRPSRPRADRPPRGHRLRQVDAPPAPLRRRRARRRRRDPPPGRGRRAPVADGHGRRAHRAPDDPRRAPRRRDAGAGAREGRDAARRSEARRRPRPHDEGPRAPPAAARAPRGARRRPRRGRRGPPPPRPRSPRPPPP